MTRSTIVLLAFILAGSSAVVHKRGVVGHNVHLQPSGQTFDLGNTGGFHGGHEGQLIDLSGGHGGGLSLGGDLSFGGSQLLGGSHGGLQILELGHGGEFGGFGQSHGPSEQIIDLGKGSSRTYTVSLPVRTVRITKTVAVPVPVPFPVRNDVPVAVHVPKPVPVPVPYSVPVPVSHGQVDNGLVALVGLTGGGDHEGPSAAPAYNLPSGSGYDSYAAGGHPPSPSYYPPGTEAAGSQGYDNSGGGDSHSASSSANGGHVVGMDTIQRAIKTIEALESGGTGNGITNHQMS